jgi:hypothetical protein
MHPSRKRHKSFLGEEEYHQGASDAGNPQSIIRAILERPLMARGLRG